jgi:hypothetical protein
MTTPISKLTASSAPAYTDQVILSQLSTSVTISGTTISAANADNSFNDSGNGFITAGFDADDYVNVTGFSNAANNIYSAKITAIAAGKMTIGGTDGDVIVDEAAGNTITITKWESYRAPYYGKQLIEEINNTTAGDFDFNNIPSGFNRIIIEGAVRGDVSSTLDAVVLYMNADTTASNYHRQWVGGSNNSTTGSEVAEARIGSAAAASSPSGSYSYLKLTIEDYAGSNLKIATSISNTYRDTDNIQVLLTSTVSSITAAITRIRIQTDNDPTDQLFGTLRLYGEL